MSECHRGKTTASAAISYPAVCTINAMIKAGMCGKGIKYVRSQPQIIILIYSATMLTHNSVLPCHWPLGLLFSKDGHGLFNMCDNLIGLLFSKDGHGLFKF